MIQKIQLDDTDIFFDEEEIGRGKVTVSNIDGYNYSYIWGSMGCSLSKFITDINDEYFASNLLGTRNRFVIDVKKTFATLRKHIRTEIGLQWYQHQDFQKHMREVLNDFQRDCEERGAGHFIDNFHTYFTDKLDYFLIDDNYDRKQLEKEFKGICEHWYFMQEKYSQEYLWLKKLHKQLTKYLKNKN